MLGATRFCIFLAIAGLSQIRAQCEEAGSIKNKFCKKCGSSACKVGLSGCNIECPCTCKTCEDISPPKVCRDCTKKNCNHGKCKTNCACTCSGGDVNHSPRPPSLPPPFPPPPFMPPPSPPPKYRETCTEADILAGRRTCYRVSVDKCYKEIQEDYVEWDKT